MSEERGTRSGGGLHRLLPGLLVVAAVLGVHGRAIGGGFVDYDDDVYVTENAVVREGLTLHGVRWALGAFHAANWHPLTWLSHMLDVELWGLEPAGHHATSIVLHAASAVLLLLFLRRTTGRPGTALVAALLFAVHPMRVESVAWVAERKDVLSGLAWMAILLLWARYAERPSVGRYLAVVLAFVLGLLAKPMLVTLPFVLLLVDVWPLGRWGRVPRSGVGADVPRVPPRPLGVLLAEKVPLLALAAASAWVTVRAQASAQAITMLERLPLETRVANALEAYALYAAKAFWPSGLAAFYPHAATVPALPDPALGAAELSIAAVLLALLLVAAWRLRREPWLLVGLGWFLGTLVPVIGVLQVGHQARADRYGYLPLVGLSLAVLWAVSELVATRPRVRRAAGVAAAAALAALAVVAWRQVGTWRSTESLWRRALAVTEHNFLARYNLGTFYLGEERLAEAEVEYRAALADRPDHHEAHYGLGLALARRGRGDEALHHFREALRLRPDYVDAVVAIGTYHMMRGDLGQAETWYRGALGMEPRHALALRNLGHVRFVGGDLAGAAELLRASFELEAPPPGPAFELALCLSTSPDPAVRDGAEALRWALRSQAALGEDPRALEAVAAAHAELGVFGEAVAWQERAVRATPAARAAERRGREERLAGYRAGRPWRSGAP